MVYVFRVGLGVGWVRFRARLGLGWSRSKKQRGGGGWGGKGMPDVNKGAGLFHERLGGGFRKGFVVSGKSVVVPGKAAWFQGGCVVAGKTGCWFAERFGGVRKGWAVSGKTGYQVDIHFKAGNRKAGCFQEKRAVSEKTGKDRGLAGAAAPHDVGKYEKPKSFSGKAGWFQEVPGGFRKGCVVLCGFTRVWWFQEVPGCFRKDWVF